MARACCHPDQHPGKKRLCELPDASLDLDDRPAEGTGSSRWVVVDRELDEEIAEPLRAEGPRIQEADRRRRQHVHPAVLGVAVVRAGDHEEARED